MPRSELPDLEGPYVASSGAESVSEALYSSLVRAHVHLAVDTQPDLEPFKQRSREKGPWGVANFDTKYHPKIVDSYHSTQ